MSEHRMSESPVLGWAAVLAGAAAAGVDPDAREVNAPCWASSRAHYKEAREGLVRFATDTRDEALARLIAQRTRCRNQRQLYDALLEHLGGVGRTVRASSELRALGRRIGKEIRLLYFAHAGPLPTAPWPRPEPRPELEHRHALGRLHIVIPFRAREDASLRPRNLAACLDGLDTQSSARHTFDVTVVEYDDAPRHRERFRDRVDAYRFVRGDGAFNKSLAVNTAAAHFHARDDVLCVLDADILVDAGFTARLRAAVTEAGAVLPYHDAFCLDRDSSARAAAQAGNGGALGADIDRAGYLITRPPGGCIALTAGLFHAVGGFDTRFTGWGGEDRDLVNRIERQARVERLPGLLIHLMHERPAMREDRDEIMRHTLAPADT